MKQNIFLFILVLFLVISGFFVYLQQNYSSLKKTTLPTTPLETQVQPENQNIEMNVYFNNEKLNPNLKDCSLVYPVKRKITLTGDPFLQILNLLFLGPTEEEKLQGYVSVFSVETKNILKNLDISSDGIAYLDFYDIRNILPEVSSSCGSSQFIKSIEETLKQFKFINKVIFAINGDPETFYEWVGLGCSEENNFCDKAPFLKYYETQG